MTNNIKKEMNNNKDYELLFKEMKDDYNNLKNKIDHIDNKINHIHTLLESIASSTKNMDNHISFVENVYTVVKKPVSNILGWYDKKTNIEELYPVKKQIQNE